MKLALFRKISLFFMSGWYFYLFVVYPFVHVHWQDDHIVTCFVTESLVSSESNIIDHTHATSHHQHFHGDTHNFGTVSSFKMLLSYSIISIPIPLHLHELCGYDMLSNAPKRGPSDTLVHTIFSHAPPYSC